MAGTNRELVEQLLRRQRELRREHARYEASYARQMEAIHTLLAAEGVIDDSAEGTLNTVMGTRRRPRDMPLNEMRAGEARRKFENDLKTARQELANDDDATTKNYVRAVLEAADGPMRMAEVVRLTTQMMGDRGNDDTARSVLQRMVHTGVATKTERGMYALAPKLPDDELIREHLRGIESATDAAEIKIVKGPDTN